MERDPERSRIQIVLAILPENTSGNTSILTIDIQIVSNIINSIGI